MKLSYLFNRSLQRQIAKDVCAVFDDVNWIKNSFMVNSVLTDVGGETEFYRCGDIDKAIKKLNALLEKLNPSNQLN